MSPAESGSSASMTVPSWPRGVLLLVQLFILALFTPEQSLAAGDDTVIITEEQIQALQAHTMADILNTIPGLSAGTSSVSIHGNSKVKVFLDGRPLNDPTSSYGAVNWDIISPDAVAQIEILRGKGGVRYGQDASGGVILITSKQGADLSGSVKTFGGNYGRFFAKSNLQWTTGPYGATLRGGYDTTDGYKVSNDKKRYQAGGGLSYTFPSEAEVALTTDYTDDKRGYAGYPDYPTPYSRVESSMAAYGMQFSWQDLIAKTWLNSGEKHNQDISINLDKTIEVDDFGTELSATSTGWAMGELNYGAAFVAGWAEGTSFSSQSENTTSLLEWIPTHGMRFLFN